MKKHDSSPNYHAPARVKKTNVFTSVVWLIPLIALIAGGWLLIKDIRNRGPVVTLLMDSAEGIEVNNTIIKVLNVDVGRVTRIKLRDDQKGVEVTAQLSADAKDLIRSDTQFWVVKPRIDQAALPAWEPCFPAHILHLHRAKAKKPKTYLSSKTFRRLPPSVKAACA